MQDLIPFCNQAQLNGLDWLAEEWLDDYERQARAMGK
jgi:hypothetical protein